VNLWPHSFQLHLKIMYYSLWRCNGLGSVDFELRINKPLKYRGIALLQAHLQVDSFELVSYTSRKSLVLVHSGNPPNSGRIGVQLNKCMSTIFNTTAYILCTPNIWVMYLHLGEGITLMSVAPLRPYLSRADQPSTTPISIPSLSCMHGVHFQIKKMYNIHTWGRNSNSGGNYRLVHLSVEPEPNSFFKIDAITNYGEFR